MNRHHIPSRRRSQSPRLAGLVAVLALGALLSLTACAVESGPPGLSPDRVGDADSDASTEDASTEDASTEDASTGEESEPADTDASTATDSSETGDDTASDLAGRTFVTTSVTGHELVPDSEVVMTFEGERLSVRAGCNTMFGNYTIEQDALQIPMMAQTQMACAEELMAQDRWLIEFLEGGPQVTLAGGTLTLTGADAELELSEDAGDS